MNAFRKRKFVDYEPSGTVQQMTVPSSKSVPNVNGRGETVYVQMVEREVSDYAKSINLPSDDEYKLADMIAAGTIPQQVNVSGMLDSNDPLDASNIGVGDRIFDKLSSEVDETEKSATVSSIEPGTAPQSSAPEPANN